MTINNYENPNSSQEFTISVFWHAAVEKHYATFIKDLAIELPYCQVKLHVPSGWEEFPGRIASLNKDAFRNVKNLEIVHSKTYGPKNYKFFFWDPLNITKSFKRSDIVIAFTEPYILSSIQFTIARRFAKTKLIMFSAQNLHKSFNKAVRIIEHFAIRYADAFMICNKEAGTVLRHKGYKGFLYPLKLGIPQQINEQSPQIHTKAKSPATRTVVYLGRLEKEKGVYDIIRIAQDLRCISFQFRLYGEGREFESLKKLSREIPNLEIHKSLTIDQVQDTLANAQLNLLLSYETPTWKEQFGRIIVEAMSHNTPTIGYATGEIPNVIQKTGYLCEQGDVEGVIESMIDYFTNLESQAEKIKQCEQNIHNYYWPNIAKNFSCFLEKNFTNK